MKHLRGPAHDPRSFIQRFLNEEISRRPFSKQLRDVRSEETVSVFVILSTTYYPSLFHLNYAKHGRISVFGQLLVVGLSAFNLR